MYRYSLHKLLLISYYCHINFSSEGINESLLIIFIAVFTDIALFGRISSMNFVTLTSYSIQCKKYNVLLTQNCVISTPKM